MTLTEDGYLMVDRATPDNPGGLEPGDVIIGYDGASWQDILLEIDSCALPVWGRTASTDTTRHLQRLGSVVNNPHLFEAMDVFKGDTCTVEMIPTSQLIAHASDFICTDQLPMEGVEPPCRSRGDCWIEPEIEVHSSPWRGEEIVETEFQTASWGIVEGTNIGYIYIYSWNAADGFTEALEDLAGTEALIIDQRYGRGGAFSWEYPFGNYGHTMNDCRRSSPDNYYGLYCKTEHASFMEPLYLGPVALLTGPHMGSAGDLFPYMMGEYSPVRLFGRTTDGRFSSGHLVEWQEEEQKRVFDPWTGDIAAVITNYSYGFENQSPLLGVDLETDVPIWLSSKDILEGEDTVVNAALEWIESH